MLSDEIIMPIITKWSRILWKKGLDYDELVAVGYCAAKPLNNKTLTQINSWTKWTIIKFIYGDNRKGYHKDNANELARIFHNKELLQYPEDDAIIDIREAISNLADYEAQLIYMRYWRSLTYTEIAAQFDKSFSWARDNCDRVLGLLKNKVLE